MRHIDYPKFFEESEYRIHFDQKFSVWYVHFSETCYLKNLLMKIFSNTFIILTLEF